MVSRDILIKLESIRISDSPLNMISLIKDSMLEILALREIAEDMYITLVNEVGDTSASRKYELYIDTINGL